MFKEHNTRLTGQFQTGPAVSREMLYFLLLRGQRGQGQACNSLFAALQARPQVTPSNSKVTAFLSSQFTQFLCMRGCKGFS